MLPFYGGAEKGATFPLVEDMKSDLAESDSFFEQPISGTEDTEEIIMQDDFSTVEEARSSATTQDSSYITFDSIAASTSPESPQKTPEVSADPAASAELSFQDAFQEAGSELTEVGVVDSGNYAIYGPYNDDAPSESCFTDPRLDLLANQVEQGRKDSTIVFQWLKSEHMITYWPPTDSYRVDRQLFGKRVQTLEELHAILTAPVRPDVPVVRHCHY